jgi:ABC-type branched-subunit amino acid transport system substrate-binding protein
MARGPGGSGSSGPPSAPGCRSGGYATWSKEATSYRKLAERVRASGARAVYLNSSPPLGVGQMIRDLRVVDPRLRIIGNQGLTPVSALFQSTGSAARGVIMTSPGLTPDALGARGRDFVRRFGATTPGHRVSNLDVYAAAATEVLLDAVAHSDGTRESVARALKRTRLTDSAIGPLALAPDGEPTTNPITVLRVERRVGRPTVFLDTEGAKRISIVDPPARLVGAPLTQR